jgi:hypothetical protein
MAAHRLRIGHVGQVRVPLAVLAAVPLEDVVGLAVQLLALGSAGPLSRTRLTRGPSSPPTRVARPRGEGVGEELPVAAGPVGILGQIRVE